MENKNGKEAATGVITPDAGGLAPEKMRPNALLRQHGPTGWLILRLQRYALLGWALFLITFSVLAIKYVITGLLPTPILVVDTAGRILGKVDFFDATARSEEEILAGGMHFLTNYMSMNSETIFEDYANAVNMMGKPLRERTLRTVKEDRYLLQIQGAGSRSRLEFAKGEDRPKILERSGQKSTLRLRGKLIVYPKDGKEAEHPFDVTLFTASIPRTTLTTQGIEIEDIRDN